MVGLVLVCHSTTLAAGVAQLAGQMAGEELKIATAGGLDRPRGALGTDATRVAAAIGEAWSEDGVLVLMDLGSAVLSAEMALDLIDQERRDRVVLTEAPFVEGAVAAAVSASLGDPLEKVANEARGALAAKAEHLGPAAPEGTEPAQPGAAEGPALRLTVENRLGLHARPAALLVRTAAGFDADLTVEDATTGHGPVSARSLNAVATLGVRHGDEIVVRAAGAQADEALAAVQALAADRFGDPPEAVAEAGPPPAPVAAAAAPEEAAAAPSPAPPPAEPPSPGAVLHGLPASPGIAVGEAHPLHPPAPAIPDTPPSGPEAEWTALEAALVATRDDVLRARDAVAGRASDYDASIFDAHLLFLEDEALLGPAYAGVFDAGVTAARAWADAVAAAAAAWERLDDPYQRARAVDLRSVGDQVLLHLLGLPAAAPAAAGIVIAADLTPAEAAALDPDLVRGVVCAFGGPTSHGAILARSLGIPAVVGLGRPVLAVTGGTLVGIDGDAGTLVVDPPEAVVREMSDRRARREREESDARAHAHVPATTRDGRTVVVAANVSDSEGVRHAVAAGADGIGLLRTEFLFLESVHLPGEDEQEQAYRDAAEALGSRPLTIRTLDVGADKQLPYLTLDREQNPFLGVRGIRLGLARPELLAGQLRAALRVAVGHPIRIMFPMVSTVGELMRARAMLDEAYQSLRDAGDPVPDRVEIGIMVEVPSAALIVDQFVPHVDFFSLGTNDLAQYVLAADRGNAGVARLADALHPAVLRLIERTTTAATAGGRAVAVCGEMAGDPAAIPLLLGLGVTELSMAPARIAAAKQIVRAVDVAEARYLALDALAAASAEDVRRLTVWE